MEVREVAVAQNPKDAWTPEQVNTIRNTVAPKASDDELKMFLSIATTYGLDPFLREIWCVDMNGRNVITTGRDGYLKIANRNPNFDGMVSDVVHAGDKFMKEGDNIKHFYTVSNRGPIIGAYAIVYRKDRAHSSYFFAPFSEYNKGFNTWKQYPSAMIQKVAEACALKRAFSISGLVTEEEISNNDNNIQQQVQPTPEELRHQELVKAKKYLWQRYLNVCDNQKEKAINAMKEIAGDKSSADFTDEDIEVLLKDIEKREADSFEANNVFNLDNEITALEGDEKNGTVKRAD